MCETCLPGKEEPRLPITRLFQVRDRLVGGRSRQPVFLPAKCWIRGRQWNVKFLADNMGRAKAGAGSGLFARHLTIVSRPVYPELNSEHPLDIRRDLVHVRGPRRDRAGRELWHVSDANGAVSKPLSSLPRDRRFESLLPPPADLLPAWLAAARWNTAAPLISPAHHTLTGAIDRRAARLPGFGAWHQLSKGQKVACKD